MVRGMACLDLTYRHPAADRPAVLAGATAVFPAGALSLVQGPTGAGKSTLLHLLAALMRPTAGEVRADGVAVSRWLGRHRERWRRQVGIIFQSHRFLPGLTALENVMLPLVARRQSLASMRRAARDLLAGLELGSLAAVPVHELSGGQKQRVALARALVTAPRFVMADEPTAHQDAAGVDLVLEALRRAADGGAVVVAAAHDPRLAGSSAVDRRLRLVNGALETLA